jgi:hypothetical protein
MGVRYFEYPRPPNVWVSHDGTRSESRDAVNKCQSRKVVVKRFHSYELDTVTRVKVAVILCGADATLSCQILTSFVLRRNMQMPKDGPLSKWELM